MEYGVGRVTFLPSDKTVPINSVAIDGTDFNSEQIELNFVDFASLTLYVKGNHASCSKEVIFKFASYDALRNQWDTEAYLQLSLTVVGTSVRQYTVPLTPDVGKIKLLSIQNQETVSGYTVDANASILLKKTFRG
jgi:hypothetical protein